MFHNSSIVTDTLDEINDPSDWANCKLPSLVDFDSYLRCQICKDFLKAPVLTTCGHVFCSICIRRAITETNKCPVCLEETYESGLRKVLLLDNIIKWFNNNRSTLLDSLRLDHVDDSQEEENSDIDDDITKISSLKDDHIETAITSDDVSENNYNSTVKDDDNLAECPICGVFMPLDEIQGSHIDNCLKKPEKKSNIMNNSSKPVQSKTITGFFDKSMVHDVQLQPKNIKNKQRMANLDTSISTSKLKEKLNLLHLSTSGSRNQMESRMKEYINLYNANLDSLTPVNDRVLADKLQRWEVLINSKSEKNNVNNRLSSSPPITYDEHTIKRQKIEANQWVNKHKDQYSELIKQARSNMRKVKNKIKTNQEESGPKPNEFSDEDSELLL